MAGFVIWLLGSSGFGADGVDLFARDVAPLLVARCLECHGDGHPSGGLTLLDETGLRTGGENGPAVVAGRSAESLLWRRVAADEMPPTQPLSTEEKAALARWIDAGAVWAAGPLDPFARSTATRAGRDFWSLQPLRDVTPPAPTGHPIDAFIGRRLAEAGLRPAPLADPRTLLRRLCFDLVGLPPTPAELEAFAADPSEAAYRGIVDRLLASPACAERWARHWLDVVRFGESDGFERNVARDHAWHYRDWVIGALAADMPYDEFVRMQLVGDQLVDGIDGAAATGFWVAGVHNTVVGSSPRMRQLARQDEIEEVLATIGQTFVGLTFHCARCHDHRFDPVSQREYYQLAAAISGLGFGDRDVAVVPGGRSPTGEPSAALATVPIHTLVAGPGEVCRVLRRGDPDLAGDVVSPGASAAIAGLAAEFGLPPDAPEAERRRRLAEWITHVDNPLFLRVIVNRVWHHHFGVGLVDTPSDFGFNGGRPSHPELLDWLAGEFRRHGLRLSWLHRLIVTSHAYRQASRVPRTSAGGLAGAAVDADNRWLWRGPTRRLEAEAVRDAMLAVSGALDDRRGGPGFRDVSVTLNNGTTYYEPIDPDDGVFRRTIYRFSPRGSRSPLLETFDCPDPSVTAPRRSVTVTPLQSLALLNDAFVLRMAEAFAGRVAAEVGADVPRQVTWAWWLALGRGPDAAERRLAETLVADHGLPALCRGLFNLTEFVVID